MTIKVCTYTDGDKFKSAQRRLKAAKVTWEFLLSGEGSNTHFNSWDYFLFYGVSANRRSHAIQNVWEDPDDPEAPPGRDVMAIASVDGDEPVEAVISAMLRALGGYIEFIEETNEVYEAAIDAFLEHRSPEELDR